MKRSMQGQLKEICGSYMYLARRMARATDLPDGIFDMRLQSIDAIETSNESWVDHGKLVHSTIVVDLESLRLVGARYYPSIIAHELAHIEAIYDHLGLYPRESEFYADCRGMELLHSVGIDPCLMIAELHEWSRHYGYDDCVNDGQHPTGRQRIKMCEKHLRNNPWLLQPPKGGWVQQY